MDESRFFRHQHPASGLAVKVGISNVLNGSPKMWDLKSRDS